MNNNILKKSNFNIIITMLFCVVISSILTFSLSVFVMQIIFVFITIPIIIKKDYKTANIYLMIFIISSIFIFLVYIANDMYYGVPYYIGGSDDLEFERWAKDVYIHNIYNPQKILDYGIIGIFHNSPFYPIYIAILMNASELFGGYSTFLPRISNVYFLLWICMISEYLLKKYTNLDNKKISITILLIGINPNLQYINSHVFRDTLNLLQVVLIMYLFDKLINNKRIFNKIYILIGLVMVIYTTYYTRKNSLIMALIVCIFMISNRLKIKKRYIIIGILVLILNTDIISLIGVNDIIVRYSELTLGNAGEGLSKYIFNKPILPFGIFFRTAYAFINPVPDILNLFKSIDKVLLDSVMSIVYIGVIIQILFTPFIIKRVIKLDWLSIVFLLLFISVIGTTFTFRHLIIYYPFMIALAVDGYLETNKIKRYKILMINIIITISLGLIYIILKSL